MADMNSSRSSAESEEKMKLSEIADEITKRSAWDFAKKGALNGAFILVVSDLENTFLPRCLERVCISTWSANLTTGGLEEGDDDEIALSFCI